MEDAMNRQTKCQLLNAAIIKKCQNVDVYKRLIEVLVTDLSDPKFRKHAIVQLLMRKELLRDLGPLLWHSFGTIAALLQEILSVYHLLSPHSLTPEQLNCVCGALTLLKAVASHPDTQMLFVNACIPLYLFPFLKAECNSLPSECLRLTSLGVIGALVKDKIKLKETDGVLSSGPPKVRHVNDDTMVVSYTRAHRLFIFNFHPTNSYEKYSVGVEEAGDYLIITNTDEERYGGRGILTSEQYLQKSIKKRIDGLQDCLQVTLPSRTFLVYALSLVNNTMHLTTIKMVKLRILKLPHLRFLLLLDLFFPHDVISALILLTSSILP